MATHCWKPWSTQPWTKPRRVPCPPASTQAATCRADIAICMDCHPHLPIICCELLLERHLLALSPPASPRPQNQFAKIDVHQLFSLGPLGRGTQLDSGSKEQARAQWHWDLRYIWNIEKKVDVQPSDSHLWSRPTASSPCSSHTAMSSAEASARPVQHGLASTRSSWNHPQQLLSICIRKCPNL